jgi:hypothetical protein
MLTTNDEQVAHNNEMCDSCGNPRFVHVQAILCTEVEPTLADILARLEALSVQVEAIASFVNQLEQAVMSHPMAAAMFGK